MIPITQREVARPHIVTGNQSVILVLKILQAVKTRQMPTRMPYKIIHKNFASSMFYKICS